MECLLVADDDRSVCHLIRRGLQNMEIAVESVGTVEETLEFISTKRPSVVILDLILPDKSGLEAFQDIQKIDPNLPIIFLTAQGSSDTTIEAVKLGAFDYLVKPLDIPKLQDIISKALQSRRIPHIQSSALDPSPPNDAESDLLVGNSPGMQEVYKAIGLVSSQKVNVMIRGESGTGKELVARAIFQHSPRASARFLAVNCAAIPEPLLESELFGHEKGSFTGADTKRIGKFEQSNGGTLFLDEVGDMTPLMQSKVLRVLQDHRFERVGGNQTLETDVWIISATNRNLEQMVAKGEFRSDLYYRLNGFTITLPPLRERGKDILSLVNHFLALYNSELGKSVTEVSFEALDRLTHYSWPGNVRELQSVLKQAMLRLSGPILLPEHLSLDLLGNSQEADGSMPEENETRVFERFVEERLKAGSKGLYAEAVAFMERHVITDVLRYTAGNQSHAAKILGITRGSLRTKIRMLGIKIGREIHVNDFESFIPEECCAASADKE
jgi:two-component system nitrogen regulation response regulator GlnG